MTTRFALICAVSGLLLPGMTGCGKKSEDKQAPAEEKASQQKPQTAPGPDAQALMAQAKAAFGGALPESAENPENPATEAKVALGRMLYFDKRLSKNQDISCNSCHSLADYGIDVREPADKRQVSLGHKGQAGGRNSPTVYNAALHFKQFWDGRAADVEEQAKGPVLNPIEMALPDEAQVVKVLGSIPGYVEAFKAAFPDDENPVSFDNMAKAIAAFERGLLTPARFDKFLAGDATALNEQELRGLERFIGVGCTSCHVSPTVGGSLFQKLGFIKPFESKDKGRFDMTKDPADTNMFKVPSLRNIAKTAPYLHDGSVATLEEMVAFMAEYQTPQGALPAEQVADIVAFLGALTGDLPTDYIAEPELPASGPETPAADPS